MFSLSFASVNCLRFTDESRLNSTDHSRFQQSDSPCAVRNVSPLFLRWFLNCYEANRLPGISCKLFGTVSYEEVDPGVKLSYNHLHFSQQ